MWKIDADQDDSAAGKYGQAGYEGKNVQQINTQQSGSSYAKLLVTDGEIRTASTRVVEL